MYLWQGLADVPADWGRSVVTIGVFDGVHRATSASSAAPWMPPGGSGSPRW